MAHITGAGLPGNVPRVLPKDCNAVIKKSSWPRPKIFNFLQKTGPVEEEEMFNVFNMGIGYVVIVAEDFADAAARLLIKEGEKVYNIGRITRGTGKSCSKTETRCAEIRNPKLEIRPRESGNVNEFEARNPNDRNAVAPRSYPFADLRSWSFVLASDLRSRFSEVEFRYSCF